MQYGIPEGSTTELPEQNMDEEVKREEKRMAEFVDSKEWDILKKHFEDRITFYQSSLPDGRTLTEVDGEEREKLWLVANIVIGELKNVITVYESTAANVQGD